MQPSCYILPWNILNDTSSSLVDRTKIVIKLPITYKAAPINPTVRQDVFFIKVFVNNPAKLNALKKQLVINAIALVSSPRSVRKSPYISPNEGNEPKDTVNIVAIPMPTSMPHPPSGATFLYRTAIEMLRTGTANRSQETKLTESTDERRWQSLPIYA